MSRRAALERTVRELAAIERPSASDGERRASQWIAERLRSLGLAPKVEVERAHGGFWWPIGLANAAAVLSRRRWVAALAAAAIWDDVGGGRLWLRRALPRRSTWNVVAEAGAAEAERTLVLVAHHDAAHSGLVFHPALPRLGMRLLGRLHERSTQAPPIMFGVWLGPLLLALGARRLGLAFALGASAAMADIGRSRVVPGANDNLSAVAVLVELAAAFAERPVGGVRVLLVSTGSEESFSEGMHGFLRRHEHELPRERTEIVALECLGGRDLVVLEGEGMLVMRSYDARLREALVGAARAAGVALGGPLRTVAATDALPALRRGWRTAALASVDATKLPRNYHWPTDTTDALDYGTVEDALAVCERLVRS